jgi:7,8-dihydropterin-6-yl-methyl-4-(beta-D-ribofuranosyl)aminobenzene 5'-phosphate synthase
MFWGCALEEIFMVLKIRTLVEDTVEKPDLIREHGLSLLISTPDGDILFDTGQSAALPWNAVRMGVDWKRVTSIVLSHGHYDHTGGLAGVLAETGARPVFAHPSAFAPKYSKKTGKLRSIGVPANLDTLQGAGMQLRTCPAPVEVAPGVLTTGPIPRVTGFEQVPPHFLTLPAEKSDLVPDLLEDDQALILGFRSAPVVVLGCAHAGIVNTLLYAAELAGTNRFSLVIGGTHLIDADEMRLQRTLEALRGFEIMKIAPCHCTGLRGQFALWENFGSAFQANHTGDRIECAD